MADGTSQGRLKRTSKITARVLNSGTFKTGRDIDNLDIVPWRNSDMIQDSPPTLFTGDKAIRYEGRFDKDDRLLIVQDKPLPLTIIAIMADVEVEK